MLKYLEDVASWKSVETTDGFASGNDASKAMAATSGEIKTRTNAKARTELLHECDLRENGIECIEQTDSNSDS